MRGKFIVFEGTDGSGKTTVLEKVKEYLTKSNIDFIMTREPGGTKIGEKIREILIDNSNLEMDDKTEALLFAAARSQNVEEVIKPALSQNKLVVSDRYVLSSLVYQGNARELGVENVKTINDFATDNLNPDYTFFLDVDPITVLERKKVSVKADRFEEEKNNFHQKVYDGYKSLIKGDKYIVIDASREIKEVVDETLGKLREILEEKWNY